MYKQCGIAYVKPVTFFSDTVSSVEIASFVDICHYVRTSYGADILPTEHPSNFLDKNIIIIVVVVTDFSELNLGFGVSYTAEVEGMATASVAASDCVPTPKRRGGGCFFTSVSV